MSRTIACAALALVLACGSSSKREPEPLPAAGPEPRPTTAPEPRPTIAPKPRPVTTAVTPTGAESPEKLFEQMLIFAGHHGCELRNLLRPEDWPLYLAYTYAGLAQPLLHTKGLSPELDHVSGLLDQLRATYSLPAVDDKADLLSYAKRAAPKLSADSYAAFVRDLEAAVAAFNKDNPKPQDGGGLRLAKAARTGDQAVLRAVSDEIGLEFSFKVVRLHGRWFIDSYEDLVVVTQQAVEDVQKKRAAEPPNPEAVRPPE